MGGGVVVAEVVEDLESLLACGVRAVVEHGNLGAGRRLFDAAYRQAERVGDAYAMAEAALGLGGLWVHEHRTAVGSTTVEARLAGALTLVDPASPLALRLRVRLAGEASYRSGEPRAILAALDDARAAGDPIALAEALSIAHHCLLGPGHAALRRALADELIALSVRTGRRADLVMGVLWQTVDLFLAADPHAGRRLAELRVMLADEYHLAVGYVVDAIDVMLAIRAGELDRAETLADRCAQRGAAAGDTDALWWHGSQLVAIRWYQGRLAEALPMLAELVHSPTLSAADNSCLAALAVAAALAGDRPRAASALATLGGRGLGGLPRSSSWLATMNGVVEAADLLGDARTAAAAYELLAPYAHLPAMGSLAIACFGSVRHALGVASLTTGDVDRAVDHLGAAVRENLALAHWPAVVASRRRLAQALTRRGRPADRAAAERELAAAASEAAPIGMASADQLAVHLVRRGRGWRVALGHRDVLVEHRVGMLHLAVLVANPGREIDAVELAAGTDALGAAALSRQPVLDRAALRGYRERLRAEIDRDEREWLEAELAAATGLRGRARPFADNRERARIAVGKAIRRAVQRVAAADPAIGEHLARCVRTGARCAYWPG